MNKNILEEAERGRHKCKCGSLVFHLASLAIKKHPDHKGIQMYSEIAICADRDCRKVWRHLPKYEKWIELQTDESIHITADLRTYIIQPETLDFAELRHQRVFNSVLDTMVAT